ncbi:hypothetical protein LTR08_003021 [Meristemomyces frigidus]|nr:hypothetical protein LTR08_003021 [Meristemomyces frigidus]
MSAAPTPERTLRSSVRNPRRRQRQSDGDSLRTSGPKRKKSKLGEDTFTSRATTAGAELDGNGDGGVGVVGNGTLARASTGHRHSRKESASILTDTELPMRSGKKAGTLKHRALKGDGTTLLTENKFYSVKLLPSTPRALREENVEYRGVLGAGHHALAITRTHAHIWDLTAHTPVGNARVVDVPFPARDGEALPFGALVTSSATIDIGLLLLSATTGRIVFYECIERAASLALFQERKTGVEGTISGFASSESVLDMTCADHAGYVLTLSSGRIVQLTLRDAQGKARIFTQPLRPGDAGSGGLFGSFKGLWSGSWKKGVTAVRTRALDQRGQMQAIALTEKCELQICDLDWSGRQEFRSSIDFREVVMQELKSLESAEMQGQAESLTTLDFVIADRSASARGNEVATLGADQPLSIWLLFKMGYADAQDFVLAELSLAGNVVSVERTTKLESYHNGATAQKPRLLLPKPGHTAVVAFEDALVLVATTDSGVSDDPNAQLHEASYIEPHSFEDAVYLRANKGLAVLGACTEDTRSGHASTLAFVKGAGLVRISATDPTGDVERSRIPVKSKMEQAVFYGALQDNILDLSRQDSHTYPTEEVEEAALAISDEILRSTTPFIPPNPTSISANLDFRARALRALVVHVHQTYPPLSRSAMWQLLSTAERLAAAQQMHTAFEQHKEAVSHPKRQATVLDELCVLLEEHHGLDSLDEVREDDLVRRFFVKGLVRIEYVLSHIRGLLELLHQSEDEAAEKVVRSVAEADDLWSGALETAFAFRKENANAYGIEDSTNDASLAESWTSSTEMLKASRKIASLSRDFAKHYFEQSDRVSPRVEQHIKHMTVLNPRLTQLCCLIYEERIAWLQTASTAKSASEASKLQVNYEADRHDHFCALATIGLANEGMQLAEKHRDMQTLTELVVMESQYYLEELGTLAGPAAEEQRQVVEGLMCDITARVTGYFAKYGAAWADAFFAAAFEGSRAGAMLDEAQRNWPGPLKKWLRADRRRGKLCWVNDVCAEGDYGHAGRVLAVAAREEWGNSEVWGRKVELSMSLLSLLAAREGGDDEGREGGDWQPVEAMLGVVNVQEKLYRHLHAEVASAIDHVAEVELAMQKFGQRSRGYGALGLLLERGVARVLDHQTLEVEELVDVLTLMDCVGSKSADESLEGGEFALALEALGFAAEAGMLAAPRVDVLVRLVWKRCFVYDDWDDLATATLTTATSSRSSGRKSTLADKTERASDAAKSTATARTLYALHLAHPPVPNMHMLPPSACLGAACLPADLSDRFPEPELLDPILLANRLHDERLAGYVADCGLEARVKEIEVAARGEVELVMAGRAEVARLERVMEEEEGDAKGGVRVRGTGGKVDVGKVKGVRDVEMV